MLGEKDGLDRSPAARTGLALAAVDLEWHRQLVGEPISEQLLVVLDRRAQHPQGLVQAADLGIAQLGPPLKWREACLPEDLIAPRSPDPRDRALVAQQRVKVAGLGDQRREALDRGRRPGLGLKR